MPTRTEVREISTRWGPDMGDEVGRAVAFEHTGHPIVRAFLDKTPCLAGPGEGATFFPGNPEGAGAPLVRAAAVPLLYQDELIGVLSVGARRGSDAWPVELGGGSRFWRTPPRSRSTTRG